jgi:hypothetical protein
VDILFAKAVDLTGVQVLRETEGVTVNHETPSKRT